jgi:phospholipase C
MRFLKPALPAALSLAAGTLILLGACSPDAATRPSAPSAFSAESDAAASNAGDDLKSEGEGLRRLKHIVVIYLENHSFDNLYGEFPGANGLAKAGSKAT